MSALKPQDVVVVLKLCSLATVPKKDAGPGPTLTAVAFQLRMSASEVHAAMKRARNSGLLQAPLGIQRDPQLVRARRSALDRPNVRAITEFLVHGLKYVFPPQRGELTRGMPTAYAAPPLRDLVVHGSEPIPVWPWAEGNVRGVAFEPLYPSVPYAALQDPLLYEYLAIADVLREGRARERKIAESELRNRLEKVNAG